MLFRARLRALQGRAKRTRAELAAHTEDLAGQMRAAYAMGEQEYLKLLLNQQDPASVARVSAYYRYLAQAPPARLGQIRASLTQLAALEKQITERTRARRIARRAGRTTAGLQETRTGAAPSWPA